MNMTAHSLADIERIAIEFLTQLSTRTSLQTQAHIVGLHGNLGAGKTTFTQAVARALGITETVTSPTFIIEKIYQTTHPQFTQLIHIDAYRLEKPEELEKLGWQNLVVNPQNLIVVEWPEKIAPLLPEHMTRITFEHVNETTREVTIDYGQN